MKVIMPMNPNSAQIQQLFNKFGEGGSFQIGSIYKLSNKMRLTKQLIVPFITPLMSLSQFLITDLDDSPNNDRLFGETEIFS